VVGRALRAASKNPPISVSDGGSTSAIGVPLKGINTTKAVPEFK